MVEGASSQAPWTLPSVISFLTGRYPGELLRGVTAYGIPEGVPSLAERLAPLGYRTGAFVANPTLHAGNGIARGFETFYSAPAVLDSMLLHADSVNVRAVPWLRSYQHEPFFLYVHYLDPHDPYDNPDLVDGRSSFDPDYRGTLTGGAVHGVYLGQVPLPDPPADVAFLTSLYDSEIHYVDRFVGELLATLDPAVLANTLVVLTADHGEELHDHGGWKHGETLYQELIHVPLIVRWDGHVRAGARLGGTVRLVDLAPTLLAAAGGGGPAGAPWAGVDLLPALAGEAPPPRLPAFAETAANGPLRAAALARRLEAGPLRPRGALHPRRPQPGLPLAPGRRGGWPAKSCTISATIPASAATGWPTAPRRPPGWRRSSTGGSSASSPGCGW